MSTTFGIPIKEASIDLQYDEILDHYFGVEDSEDNYDELFIQVWFRGSNCRWLNPLAELLPDDTKVYALDNGQQGVHTIGDIKKIMKQKTNEL